MDDLKFNSIIVNIRLIHRADLKVVIEEITFCNLLLIKSTLKKHMEQEV